MGLRNRQDSPALELHPWPRPLNAKALKFIKVAAGATMIVVLLSQLLPLQLIGGLMNNFFTILVLLSWAGPARRLLRRYSPRGKDSDTRDE